MELQINRVRNKRAGPVITLVRVKVQTPVQATIVKGADIPSALPTYWLAGRLFIVVLCIQHCLILIAAERNRKLIFTFTKI